VLSRANLDNHVGIPLVAVGSIEEGTSGEVLGMLIIAWRTAHAYSEADRTLLTAIGQQVGLALRNAQLYQAARQVNRLQVLNQLDRALSATLNPETVAEITLHQIAAALDAPRGVLVLCDRRADSSCRQILTLTQGWVTLALPKPDAERLESFLERFRSCHEAVLLSADTLDELRVIGDQYTDVIQGRESDSLAVPICSDGELMAVLALGGRPADRPFSDEDQELAQVAAGRAGQAIQNAQLYDELKVLLRERERVQAQLIHAEKMSALGRLVASVAHEINNPLQAVQSCLTLAGEELDEQRREEALKRYLDIAESEIDRVSSIVRRMRDFYRPARDGMQPVDLHSVLESVLTLTHKQLQHSGITVERAWADPLPMIRANADHLKQVFLNLVLNAIDAMPEGGTLCIATALGELPGDVVDPPVLAARVEFSDTGMGIAPEALSRLFEPFFTTKEHGSWLGLSISYGIIESHGGQITVASQVGEGSTFRVWLPLDELPPSNGLSRGIVACDHPVAGAAT
jgi:signal transduction histidine kinase